MGRSPCCEKVGLKKGPWTPEEDQKLSAYIEKHGNGSWRALPGKAGLKRCGKSCRLRWTNYLRPDIKRGKFSLQDEQTIIQLHALLGNRWSTIATHLPKRTDNEIKNYWNTHLKKRLAKMGIDPVTHKPKNEAFLSTIAPSKSLSHMAQWENARLEAEARLAKHSKLRAGSLIGFPMPDSALALDSLMAPVRPLAPDSPMAPVRSLMPDSHPASDKPLAPYSPHPSAPATLAPQCLDILKAWSGSLTPPPESDSEGGNMESPTSRFTFSDNVVSAVTLSEKDSKTFIEFFGDSSSLMKEEGEEEWKSIENSIDLPEINNSPWFMDLLLNGNGHSSIDGCVEIESGDARDYYEDNKNYWNSILNLVNSSPSDSPVF